MASARPSRAAAATAVRLLLRGQCKHSKERGAFGICAEREQED